MDVDEGTGLKKPAPFEIHETVLGYRLLKDGKHIHDFDSMEKAEQAIAKLVTPVVHKYDAAGNKIK
jgi:hypothetical protein